MTGILKLTSENVKRIRVVEITPKGNTVVISGKNGQGKSSILDSIEYAFGGDTADKMPVRRGEAKARIVADLGDLIVKRTFTAEGGTSLVVTNADGVKQASPQKILDDLVGKLTFDPLEFAREKPIQQGETLRKIVGLDFTEHDKERERIFSERTNCNREAKQVQGSLVTHGPKFEGVPEEETSTATILEAQAAANTTNSANATKRQELRRANEDLQTRKKSFMQIEAKIAQLKNDLEAAEAEKATAHKTGQEAVKKVEALMVECGALKDADVSGFAEQLRNLESVNSKIRKNKDREAIVKKFKEKNDEADKLTAKLEEMDRTKREKINAAKYPIEGLAFDTSGGVTLAGIPFNQASTAEQLRVSIAIGLALNPKLRILMIRSGNDLDDDSMEIVRSMAEQAKAQVWIERIATDAQTSVVIEDGAVKSETLKESDPK